MIRRTIQTADPRGRTLLTFLRSAALLRVPSIAAAFCCAILAVQPAAGDDPPERPFYEQEPYDLVILNDSNKTEIKIVPLNLPNGKLPKSPRPLDKIRLRRFEDPDEEYEVQWQNISEVKLFEHLVIEQAKRRIAEGKFNEAFTYFEFLRSEYPAAVGLDDAFADFLYDEAGDWHRKGNYENALVLLRTLFDRQPQRPRLESAMAAATGKLVEKYVAAGDHATVRRLVRQLHAEFPNGTTAAQFEAQMNARAVEVVAAGRAKLDAGDPQEAMVLARRAMSIWPQADGAAALAGDAFSAFSHVVVGVTAPYTASQSDPLTDWSARRTHRLLVRDLFEFIGSGANGGEYLSPFGRYDVTDLGRKLSLRITPHIAWARGGELSGYDIARRLLAVARPGHADFLPGFAEACDSVKVLDVETVDIRFRTPQLLPMALLTIPAAGHDEGEAGWPASIDPYLPQPPAGDHTNFLLGPDYFARTSNAPQAVVEQVFATRSDALEALREGQVSIVDRLPPWEIARLKGVKGITVEPYVVPIIHCLLPNLHSPFMKNRGFRRALVYGIDRPRILNDHILRRNAVAGCAVISGPFPKGSGLSDASGYAYNDNIAPRAYEPRLALTLSSVALRELQKAESDAPDQPKELPKLTLAHGADEVILIACKEIQKNLELIGLQVELREIPADQPVEMGEEDDLLYLELSVKEPLVDARRLFDEAGVFGHASTYMSLVLRQVETATGWKEARQALYDLHRLVHDEVSIVPLWQITEYFAYRSALGGMRSKPESLYQSIEEWQAKAPTPLEEP